MYPLQWHVGNSDLLETGKQMICFPLPYFSITIIWIICLDVSVSGNLFPASHLFLVTVFSDVTPFSDFLPTPLSLDNVCPWHLFLLACFSLGVSFFCHPFLLTRDISVPSQLFLLASLSFGNSFSSHIFCFDILGKQVVAPWHSNATALSTGLQNTKKNRSSAQTHVTSHLDTAVPPQKVTLHLQTRLGTRAAQTDARLSPPWTADITRLETDEPCSFSKNAGTHFLGGKNIHRINLQISGSSFKWEFSPTLFSPLLSPSQLS